MAQLTQILGVAQSVRERAEKTLTDAQRALQRHDALSGIARTYRPKDDAGDQLPPESTLVQIRADEVVTEIIDTMSRYFDITATKDATNGKAVADIVLEDGTVLLRDVPGTTLLFLEKQLALLQDKLIEKLPILPPGAQWTRDQATDTWVTDPVETTRTNKVPRNHVLAEPTDKHPAQVQMFTEDVVVGFWQTRRYSGAMPATRVRDLCRKIEALRRAVRYARERANQADVVNMEIGKVLLDHLFSQTQTPLPERRGGA